MNTKTREITEGAMIVAIAGAFLLLDRYLANLLQGYLFWVMPLPLMIYGTKYGWKKSILPFISVILVSFFVTDIATVILTAVSSLTGLVYGGGVHTKKSNSWLLLAAFICTTINYALTMVIVPMVMGYNLLAEYEEVAEMYLNMVKIDDAAQMKKMILQMIPIVLLLSAALEAFLVHLIAHLILPKLKFHIEPIRRMTVIRLPKWIGWILLAIVVAGYANMKYGFWPAGQDVMYVLAITGLLVFMVFGYIDICIIARLTGRKILVFFAFMLLFMSPLFIAVYGMLDVLTDFRDRFIERYSKNSHEQ